MLKHRRRTLMGEINVVPYIDVMLVLLVIFMVTAPLLTEGVKVDLPQADAKTVTPKQAEPLLVSIDKKGGYFLNNKPIELDELQKKAEIIIRRNPKIEVYVRGDQAANYGAVVKAMARLQAAGAESVGLITEPDGNTK